MAIQGLISTDDIDPIAGTRTDERPMNWRQGILMRYPNGHAPLTALTSKMKKKVTDDPQYYWWEREVSNVRIKLGQNLGVAAGAITVVADPYGAGGGEQTKPGDLLLVEESGELLTVTAAGTAAEITIARTWGSVVATEVLYAGAKVNPNLLIVGSIFEEGADTPESVRYRASKITNFTQIFRNSLKATRTAMQTRLRTVDEVRDAKQQALLYHGIAMEHGFIWGEKIENTGGSEVKRSTGGIIQHIDSNNIAAFNINTAADAPAAVSWDEMEPHLMEMFRFGSQEKLALCGNRAMLAIQQMIRRSDAASVEMTPTTKEYGMDVRRLFCPSGTLILKTHPLFNQNQSSIGTSVQDYFGMDSWMMVIDMGDLTYRPLRNSDTQYLPDRQANGVDGLTSEYLTECGLEIAHGKHHYLLKGLVSGGAEP
jgi:hypothetical protein